MTDATQAAAENTQATDTKSAEAVAALHTQIKANFNNKVDIKETSFFFRKVKDEASGVETKRPTVKLPIPTPSVEGIVAIIEAGGKGLELLLEACYDYVVDQAREYVNANENVDETNFPYETLSWEHIANLPKAERRGGGIAKEQWEDFAKDYIAVMPAVINKPKEAVELAAKLFLNKFNAVKTDKKVLTVLNQYLGMYLTASPRAEEFVDCVEALMKKAEALLAADSSKLLEAL